MRNLVPFLAAALPLSLAPAGCGGQQQQATSTSSASGSGGAGGSTTASAGGSTASAGGGGQGGAEACTPTGGKAIVDAICDQIQIAVLGHGAGQAKVSVRGRLTGPMGACFRIDSVDLVNADSSLVQHLAASEAVHSDDITLWATADAIAAVSKPCASDTPRAEAFSVIVQGATDGGTFKASCGAIEVASYWPPRVQLTCHDGLDEAPSLGGDGMVDVNMQFGVVSTQVSMFLPQSDGVTSVDAAVHVIPEVWMGQPIMPFDTMGWMTSLGASLNQTQVTLISDKDLLGMELCPVPPPMPDPMHPPPPIFLARLTGQTAKGAFSSEIYVPICTRLVM